MSRLDELIQKLCPNGVEYKTIGTICETLKKATLKKGELKSEGYPVINSGRTLYGYYDKYNNEGPAFTVAARGEYAAFVNYFDKRFWAGGLCYPYKSKDESKISTKFIYYSLKNIQQRIRDGIVAEGSIPALNKSDFENIKLPIPPLDIQREIVRILDNFTELTAELTAEITARKKQYEYYRDTLLTFDDNNPLHSLISHYCPNGVEHKKLGDVCDFVRGPFGGALKKNIFKSSGYAVYEQQHAIYKNLNFRYFIDEKKFNELKRFSVNAGDIIISCSGTIGETYIIPCNAPCGVINQALLKLTPAKNINVFYLQYFFKNKISKLLNGIARGGAIKNVPSVNELKSITIPVPPLEVQRQIVQILDRFDALCNDLTQGLPAEIEARRKQYEYYRDQLLTFKRA